MFLCANTSFTLQRTISPKIKQKMALNPQCAYVALHFPPVHSIYFRMKGHTLASELLLLTEMSLWMFHSNHTIMSL